MGRRPRHDPLFEFGGEASCFRTLAERGATSLKVRIETWARGRSKRASMPAQSVPTVTRRPISSTMWGGGSRLNAGWKLCLQLIEERSDSDLEQERRALKHDHANAVLGQG